MVITEDVLRADLVVVGGGISGICAAVAAARNGVRVILVHDRPMLGGNASSEIRMVIAGARETEYKEGGLIEELLLKNLHDNPTMNYFLWDQVMYSFLLAEKNIRVLLNTSIQEVVMEGSRIRSVKGWNSHNYTRYTVEGALFADCSGDSILRLSGAEFRQGREAAAEFGEAIAPAAADARTMGNSILLQLRRTPEHRPFKAPDWAYHWDSEDFPRRGNVGKELKANNFWWLEYGGVKDTVKDADEIRHELLRITLGVWEAVKNGDLHGASGWELAWIGALPGKRESARYVGDTILTENDVLAGGKFEDVVAHGGWPLDVHVPEGFFSPEPATTFHPTPPCFGIPGRVLYSVNIDNLLFAGRNISASHVGFSSTRVMGTCAVLGQATGTIAALAIRHGLTPRRIQQKKLEELQELLMLQDQWLPGKERKISTLSHSGSYTHPVLGSGNERGNGGEWFAPGSATEIAWEEPQTITGFRIVFDSDFADKKRMCKYVPEAGEIRSMPPMLAKRFRVSARVDGEWRVIACGDDNYRRLILQDVSPVSTGKIRLELLEAWGDSEIHVFGFEAF